LIKEDINVKQEEVIANYQNNYKQTLVMKTTIAFLTFLLLIVSSVYSQIINNETKEIYPEKYTFEKADEFYRKGEYEKAIWFYINLFPDNKAKVIDIIETLATKLDTVDMGTLIKTSFAIYGTFDPAITSYDNGQASMDMGKLKLKGSWGDEIISKISITDKHLTSASEYSVRAFNKFKATDYKGAIEDLNYAINIEPTGEIYFNRAYAKSMIEDFEGAIQDFSKAIELKYQLEESYFERGYCKEQINNNAGAIEDLSKAIKINKEFAKALNNRAILFAENKDYKAAIKDFDRVIKLMPDKAEVYASRGIVKKELGDKSGACADWKKAFDLGYRQVRELIYENCK
jgi:tetratricopeptide (TPR) repeat protein